MIIMQTTTVALWKEEAAVIQQKVYYWPAIQFHSKTLKCRLNSIYSQWKWFHWLPQIFLVTAQY